MAVTASAPLREKAQTFSQRYRLGDQAAYLTTLLAASSVLLLAAYLVYELWMQSATARHAFGFGFLFSSVWDPNTGKFGALPYIYGTLVTSVLALVISIPFGVGAAIFLSEMATPRWSSIFTFLVELLAAVPSVIYGLLAMFTLVPLVRNWLGPALQKSFGFLPLF